LKDYHIGRFRAHFETQKGKRLVFSGYPLLKIALLFLTLSSFYFLYVLLLVYLAESIIFVRAFVGRGYKKPVITSKTTLLICVVLVISAIFLFTTWGILSINGFIFAILTFDVLAPVIISLIVLLFQPVFVAIRIAILNRAKNALRKHSKLRVIGITGSYGKTATKEFLATIVASKFNVLSTPEHKNSEMGIAQTILRALKPEHEIFIVEMGAYSKGGIQLLCDMTKPEIGIVTGVNEQHLATFGSMEHLLSAEGGQELLAALPSYGLLVVNGDNQYCLDLYKKAEVNKKMYTASKTNIQADIWAEEISIKPGNLDFMAINQKREAGHIAVHVLGKQQAQNLLAAILVAQYLGITMEEIIDACRNIKPEQAGMTMKNGIHGITIIDASYSANPDGVYADLEYLKIFYGKKIIVMPCLIELGTKSSEIHKRIGKKIAEVCDMAIITTGAKFEEIRSAAAENHMPANKILLCGNPQEIFHEITAFCSAGDVILLEGRVPGELISLLNG